MYILFDLATMKACQTKVNLTVHMYVRVYTRDLDFSMHVTLINFCDHT